MQSLEWMELPHEMLACPHLLMQKMLVTQVGSHATHATAWARRVC